MENVWTFRRLPISLSVLAFAAFLTVFLIPFYRFVVINHGDYPWHYAIATEIRDSQFPAVPHILYHLLITMLADALALSQAQASVALVVFFRVLTGVFLYIYFQASAGLSYKTSAIITFIFLLTVPIYLLEPYNIAYINYTIYHNPTQILLHTFVVPVSLVALRALVPQPFKNLNRRVFFTMLSALLVTTMLLSKPTYTIALLPGVILFAAYRSMKRLPIDRPLLVFGFVLPQVLMLGLQYLVTYGDPQRASVRIGFLQSLRYYGIEVGLMDVLPSVVISIVFPLAVYLLYYKEAFKDDYFNLSWLTFGISFVWSFFFYEDGPRLNHGNFVMTASSTLFVLTFSAILFLVKHHARRLQAESLRAIMNTAQPEELDARQLS